MAALPMVSGYDRAAAAGRSARGTLGRLTSVEDIGEWTPAPAAHRHTAAVLQLEPGQLAMVAVHTWDMHGAARAALTAAWASCVPPDATAFVHRSELFQIKHAAVVDPPATTAAAAAAHRWVVRSWSSEHPWGSGRVFQNFADPDLDNWADAYYRTNYDRLVRIKTHYDPTNAFRSHQSLPAR